MQLRKAINLIETGKVYKMELDLSISKILILENRLILKDSIIGNLDVITTTANIIIKSINKHIVMDEAEEQAIHGDLVTQGDVAKLLKAPIGKKEPTIDEVIDEINEARNIFKTILN